MAAGLAVAAPAAADAQPAGPGHTIASGTSFYVEPHSQAAQQALSYLKQGDRADALTMAKLASYPEATWFEGGTPAEVRAQVADLEHAAAAKHQTPVLVAYYVPGRDCSQFSAGGAPTDAAYRAWIAGLASGIGNDPSVVIVEPDGLANLPSDCSPTTDPTGELTAGRIADVKYAVDVLEAQPNTAVYLDAGHSQWHSVGDMAIRLVQAGLDDAQGFFINVSNFQPTAELDQYGTWIAKCAWFAGPNGPSWALGHYDWCASQYYSGAAPNDGQPGNAVSPSDPSTWHWTDLWYEQNGAGNPPVSQLTRFVVDTSRNGLGAWKPNPADYPGDPQNWCNPPDRGIGARPTADTGVPLVDAYLWVKTIGESDGQCNRGYPLGSPDPVYGSVDPPAGAWWPQQALTLANNANPPLRFAFPH